MAKKISGAKTSPGRADLLVSRGDGEAAQQRRPTKPAKPSALLDTRVVYCGGPCRTGHHWGETEEKHAGNSAFRTPHSAFALAGSFYYHCDWHASHYVKVVLDQIFGENNLTN